MEMKKLKPSPAPVYGLTAFYQQSTRRREPKTRPERKLGGKALPRRRSR